MTKLIAHLGPSGTYSELATLFYADLISQKKGTDCQLIPYASIAQTLTAVAKNKADVAVVPIENSIQGTVTTTLDTLWELEGLHIHQALVLPVIHNLLSRGRTLQGIKTVYSHPQALAQCQKWLQKNLPQAKQIATNSTTEALHHINHEPTSGAIASERAAKIYNLPIKSANINDYEGNCTRFWVISTEKSQKGQFISLGFAFAENVPGVLVKPLQIFADKKINLTKIESRPIKQALGHYLFFLDLAGDSRQTGIKTALEELERQTTVLKIFGSYDILTID